MTGGGNLTWVQARTQMRNPKAKTSHQSQAFSSLTSSVDLFTIRVHLARERPKPARAPYLAAMVWQKHMRSRKPTQLKRKAVRNAVKNDKSVPSRFRSISVSSQSPRLKSGGKYFLSEIFSLFSTYSAALSRLARLGWEMS